MRLLVPLLAVLSLAPIAHAQDETDTLAESMDDEARGLFLAGRAAFEGQRYAEAQGHFQRAYDLSERPALLFNLGHAAQLAGDLPAAVQAFDDYLRLVPDAANHRAVGQRVQRLRSAIQDEQERADRMASLPDSARPQQRPSILGPMAVVTVGVALVVAGGATLGFAGAAANEVNRAPPGTPWVDVQSDHEAAGRRRTLGSVFLGAGAVLAVAGGIWWRLRKRPSVELALQPTGATIRGTF